MPSYDYECATCGSFTADRPMAAYDLPADCPSCGRTSPRTLTLPQVAGMDAVRRSAFAINEQSAHAPRSTRAHGAGCPCCRPPASTAPVKGFAGKRPWMISH